MKKIDCDKCKSLEKREAVCYCVDCNQALCSHHEAVSDGSCVLENMYKSLCFHAVM